MGAVGAGTSPNANTPSVMSSTRRDRYNSGLLGSLRRACLAPIEARARFSPTEREAATDLPDSGATFCAAHVAAATGQVRDHLFGVSAT